MRMLAEMAGSGRVLDIGYAQNPNRFDAAASVVGLDLTSMASPPAGYDQVVCGDASDPASALDGERFDTVVAGEFIEHLEDPLGFLRRVREVLAPGGRLVLSTPNPTGLPVLLVELLASRRWFYTDDHVFYLPPRWVWRLLEVAGFEVVATRPVGIWLPFGVVPWSPVGLSYQVVYEAVPRG